jgi:hypothetical protein
MALHGATETATTYLTPELRGGKAWCCWDAGLRREPAGEATQTPGFTPPKQGTGAMVPSRSSGSEPYPYIGTEPGTAKNPVIFRAAMLAQDLLGEGPIRDQPET